MTQATKEQKIAEALSRLDSENLPFSPPVYPPRCCWTDKAADAEIIKRWTKTLALPNDLALYVHVPFCSGLCKFCGFYALKLQKPADISLYVELLQKEVDLIAPPFGSKKVKWVRFGGGTPSLLRASQFEILAKHLRSRFVFADSLEFVVETAVDQLDEARLKAYKNAGVNWLEIGVQSLDGKVLRLCGRKQTASRALSNISLAKKYAAGIAVDLMFGLIGQSKESFFSDIAAIARLRPTRISLYNFVANSNNNNMYKLLAARSRDPEQDAIVMEGLELLKGYGYKIPMGGRDGQYWGWDGKAPDYDDRWPFTFCKSCCAPYSVVGVGPGAMSHAYTTLRYQNHLNFDKYVHNLKNKTLPLGSLALLTDKSERISYTVLKIVNQGEKIDKREIAESWGAGDAAGKLKQLAAQGLISDAGKFYKVRADKLSILNGARKAFFEEKILSLLADNLNPPRQARP